MLILLAFGTAAAGAQVRVDDAATRTSALEPASGDTLEAAVPAQQLAPEDPWNRGTPRSAVRSYLEAARDGRWSEAVAVLDLSAVPAVERATRGVTIARELKYLLDHGLWIDLEALSDAPAGELDDGLPASREFVGRLQQSGDARVYLERRPREDGVAIWMISAGTVARVPALYAELGPPRLTDHLPAMFTDVHFLEVALWQWAGLIALAVVAWLVAWAAAGVIVRLVQPLTSRSRSDFDDRLLGLLVGPARLLIAVAAFNAGVLLLRLSVPATGFLREATKFLLIAGVAWTALRFVELLGAVTRERFTRHGKTGAAYLVPLGARAVKVAVLVLTALATLDTFGFDVTAILAGLGVGGLAVALAAQKTVENIFGGVSILVDQPVRPGDFCRFGDQVGTVEDIGLRSTRIRTLERTVVSVPNADFSTLRLENFAPRDRIRLLTTVGLRYETTPDQLRYVISELRAMLIAHPRILPDPLRVRLVNLAAYSIDLELFAYVDSSDYNDFLAVREDIFLRIIDIVTRGGTGFAFPSSTTYWARDGGLDSERQRAVESEVAALRAEGRLQFPDHGPEARRAIDGTLDWPPRGSAQGAR
jgi:MscS family membrane protein